MAKLLLTLSALLVLLAYIEAATSPGLHPTDAAFTDDKQEEAGPTLNSRPRRVSEDTNNNNDMSTQGQRQKRFYNFYNFGFPSYSPFNPTYVKRDNSQDTGFNGSEDPWSQIYKRVQDILIYTRQQAFSPPSASHVSYIPVFYIPSNGCGCTPDNNQGPNNDEEPSTGVPAQSHTTTTTSPMFNPAPATPSPNDNEPVNPPPTDDMPDFPSRLPDMDEEYGDGARPISFEPVKPNRPTSRPPPPVDHGSSQAGSNSDNGSPLGQDAPVNNIRPPTTINRVPAQPDLPTNAIPTLCDGAVLTCCHRTEVTYDCFTSQGCPDPMPSNSPCDANVILNVIRKFQYYYANRKVSNTLS